MLHNVFPIEFLSVLTAVCHLFCRFWAKIKSNQFARPSSSQENSMPGRRESLSPSCTRTMEQNTSVRTASFVQRSVPYKGSVNAQISGFFTVSVLWPQQELLLSQDWCVHVCKTNCPFPWWASEEETPQGWSNFHINTEFIVSIALLATFAWIPQRLWGWWGSGTVIFWDICRLETPGWKHMLKMLHVCCNLSLPVMRGLLLEEFLDRFALETWSEFRDGGLGCLRESWFPACI